MTDLARLILVGVARGLRDSLVGTLRVYQLGKEKERKEEEQESEGSTPSTILAQRRAMRMKHHQSAVKKDSQPKVIHRVLMCCAWNGGVFWASIWIFNALIVPCLELLTNAIFGGSSTHTLVWSYTGPVLSWTFSALWVLPLFILSKIINSFWFQDIADAAYRKSRGRPQLIPNVSKIVADILFSLLLQSLFLFQGMLARLLPVSWVGDVVYQLHMCLLYSLYAFEYKWFNMGWEIHKRLSYIESNWPYFLGFGLPLAIFTSLPSSNIVSGCVFSILFPLLIVSGNEAEPVQESFDFPLRLFSIVISISNVIFRQSVKSNLPLRPPAGDTTFKTASGSNLAQRQPVSIGDTPIRSTSNVSLRQPISGGNTTFRGTPNLSQRQPVSGGDMSSRASSGSVTSSPGKSLSRTGTPSHQKRVTVVDGQHPSI